MARSKIKVVQFRRKREGKTNYKKRLGLLMSGKPRLVIRKSLKSIWLQVVEYSASGDRVVLAAHSNELKKIGWNFGCGNTPSSYLTGFLIGKKAAEKKIGGCILDIGLYPSIKGNRIYAALKGAIDGGMKIPFSEDVLPGESRIKGQHIADFVKKIKEQGEGRGSQFSLQNKNNINPENIIKGFEEIKQKLKGK